MLTSKLVKIGLVGLIMAVPIVGATAQPQQPFDLTSHFLGKIVPKFDTVLMEPIASTVEAVTGQILTAELSFRLDNGQRSTFKAAELAALIFDAQAGAMRIVLRDGRRLKGELLTNLEVALAGTTADKITIAAADVLFVLWKDQLQPVSNDEFVQLLDRVRRLPTKRDVLVLSNDAFLAGEVLNPLFKIKTTTGQEETVMRSDILEIVLGAPGQHQLRTRSGRVLTGTIQTEGVTISLAGNTRTLATRALAQALFTRQIPFGGRICKIVPGVTVTQGDDDPCSK